MKKIVSALDAPTVYAAPPDGLSPIVARRVVVPGRGSAHRPFVVAEISDEDAAFLADHPHFVEHQRRGFVKIV